MGPVIIIVVPIPLPCAPAPSLRRCRSSSSSGKRRHQVDLSFDSLAPGRFSSHNLTNGFRPLAPRFISLISPNS
ncbi:hypothetical protein BRADI_1g63365v3 [Brachypodium distachyon]|uniref:Uncharacterized protein n=1 Tax=Brachypodium distachyon TaxID=15368 RepID=A0A0Q3NWD5_BRADI|nr:hypothetical protein BRADI_1g63365v3 [Brachypodium distachyon]